MADTANINVQKDVKNKLKAKAAQKGLSLKDYLKEIAEKEDE